MLADALRRLDLAHAQLAAAPLDPSERVVLATLLARMADPTPPALAPSVLVARVLGWHPAIVRGVIATLSERGVLVPDPHLRPDDLDSPGEWGWRVRLVALAGR